MYVAAVGELAYAALATYLAQGPHPLPEIITRIPWLGEWLQEAFNRLAGDPAARTAAGDLARKMAVERGAAAAIGRLERYLAGTSQAPDGARPAAGQG